MSNEAAERLRSWMKHQPLIQSERPAWEQVLDKALDTERKATVERIREDGRWKFVSDQANEIATAILDAEAAR